MGIIWYLISLAIDIYILLIVVHVAFSWLISFEIINATNKKAKKVVSFLNKVTEPVFAPIRKYIPSIGGIDITPLIVIVALSILQQILGALFV